MTNILTEVNCLINDIDSNIKSEVRSLFGEKIKIINEDYYESKLLSNHRFFNKIGLADVSIVYLAKKNFLVFTTDLPLTNFLQHLKLPVINWNNLKPYIWVYF